MCAIRWGRRDSCQSVGPNEAIVAAIGGMQGAPRSDTHVGTHVGVGLDRTSRRSI